MNWPNVKLSDVASTTSGGTPKREKDAYYGGDIAWIKSGELSKDIITNSEETITEEGLRNSSAKLMPPSTILLAMYGATVGAVSILGIPAATNQAICCIQPNADINCLYLKAYLKSIKQNLLAKRVGGAQPNLSQDLIRNLQIPLPPLAEQKRIAAILDKADEIRRKREQTIAKLDQLAQSIFVKMFGNVVINDKEWDESKQLYDVAEIVSGITKGRKLNGAKIREIPYLAVLNVQDKRLNMSVVKTIEATDVEINRYIIQKNDLLLTEGGDPDKLGRGTLWNNELPECIHQNHIFRVRITARDLSPRFLNWLIGSERGKKYFLKSAKQTTGIASINMEGVLDFV